MPRNGLCERGLTQDEGAFFSIMGSERIRRWTEEEETKLLIVIASSNNQKKNWSAVAGKLGSGYGKEQVRLVSLFFPDL